MRHDVFPDMLDGRLPLAWSYPHEELTMTPTKEYHARIRVKLTDELLPSPVLSGQELQDLLIEALNVGKPDSPIVTVSVRDPR